MPVTIGIIVFLMYDDLWSVYLKSVSDWVLPTLIGADYGLLQPLLFIIWPMLSKAHFLIV